MNSTTLKDFRPDDPDFNKDDDLLPHTGSEIPTSTHHEGINTLKIKKLSNKIAIISVILPCLIGAILVFGYFNIKERMINVDLTKQDQVEKISQQLEEKINALNIKIAENKFDLDNKLPELDKKTISLEGQLAKLSSTKTEIKTIKNQFTKLEKQVKNNAYQNKIMLQTIEKINNQSLSLIKDNQNQFDKTAQQIKEDVRLFKEEFNVKLLELSNYEQGIGELRKNLSLLDKKLNQQANMLNQKLIVMISELQKDLDQLSKSSSTNISPTPPELKPQATIDSSESMTIEEKPLIE